MKYRPKNSVYVINPFVSEEQRAACYARKDPAWDCQEWSKKSPSKLSRRKAKKKGNTVANLRARWRKKRQAKKGLVLVDNKGRSVLKSRGISKRNPLRLDPTRTITIRRAFAAKLKQRFLRLKLALRDLLVKQDAFGLLREAPAPAENLDYQAALERAALATDPNPSPAQREAGNYRKGKVTVQGLPISIETLAGSKRKPWHEKPLSHHYGYIRLTESSEPSEKGDGEHVDVFLGPDLDSGTVYVIDQKNPKTGDFDEHKAMLGFTSLDNAEAAYHANYSSDWQGFDGIRAMPISEFREWVGLAHNSAAPSQEETTYPAVNAEEDEAGGEWITIGGHPEAGTQHSGGFPVLLKGGMIIGAAMKGLIGKHVSQVKSFFDKLRGKSDGGKGPGTGGGGEGTPGTPERAPGTVEEETGRSSSKGAGQGGETEHQSTGEKPAEPGALRVPADSARIQAKLDRLERFFQQKGNHEVGGWLGKLRKHVQQNGTAESLKDLGPKDPTGKGQAVRYEGGWDSMGHFAESYLGRHGITMTFKEPEGLASDTKVISSMSPSQGASKGIRVGDFTPSDPHLKDKLEEAKRLPGLERSEKLSKVAGKEVTHLTPDVVSKLDKHYGKDQWIVKPYGNEAFSSQGVYFSQRAEQVRQDAQATIKDAEGHLAKYGFSLRRDASGKLVGLEHKDGGKYDFGKVHHWEEEDEQGRRIGKSRHEGSEHYEKTLYGDARHWADRAAEAADHEHGIALPQGGKEYMAQPAFPVVGVSEAERAAGVTIKAGQEGRVHVTTQGGKVSVIPHTTWLKKEHLPVVFETDDTRAMADAAKKAIEALPHSDRQGQIYAPDIVKTKDGYRVVEANPANKSGSSGYLGDSPLIIDSYVSHLTGREPAHVQFLRKLLSKRTPTGNALLFVYAENQYHPLENAFCATGEGGGVDPSCGSSSGGSSFPLPASASSHSGIAEVHAGLSSSAQRAVSVNLKTVKVLKDKNALRAELQKRYPGIKTDQSQASYDRHKGVLYITKDAPAPVIAHELGHVADGSYEDHSSNPAFFRAWLKEGGNLSQYAESDRTEGLAELFRLRHEKGAAAVEKLAPKMTKALGKLWKDPPATNQAGYEPSLWEQVWNSMSVEERDAHTDACMERAVWGLSLNYDPSEPRDEQGRWTTGGGGTALAEPEHGHGAHGEEGHAGHAPHPPGAELAHTSEAIEHVGHLSHHTIPHGVVSGAGVGSTLGSAMAAAKLAGLKVEHIEHLAKQYITDKIGAAVARLPAVLQKPVNASFFGLRAGTKAAFVSYTAGQAVAERVALAKGASPEAARRLRGVLATVDVALAKPTVLFLGPAASFVPMGSSAYLGYQGAKGAAYLAYSTAKDPVGTWEAAKKAVSGWIPKQELRKTLGNNELAANSAQETVEELYEALRKHDFQDWYIALLHAALEDSSTVSQAIQAANSIYADRPVDKNPSVNTRWSYQSDPEKVKAFQDWLRQQLAATLKSQTEEELWNRYIQEGYRKGAGRSFDDVRKAPLYTADEERLPFYLGTREEFLRSAFAQPESVEKVTLLASRSFDELKNVTEDMATKISRSLVDGLVQGSHPLEIARKMEKAVDLSIERAQLIARTELIRAHASGQLTALKNLEVEAVGVAVEFASAGDASVCAKCSALEGIVLSLEEAEGIIPVHPNCLISPKVRIYTADGWRAIGDVKVGDLVLTHKGRFRKVNQTHQNMGNEELVIEFSLKLGGNWTKLKITGDHPVLVNKVWKAAKHIRVGDKVRWMVTSCAGCNATIPFTLKYCSQRCQWNNQAHRENVASKNSEEMKRQYAAGERDPATIATAAQAKARELREAGEFNQGRSVGEANGAKGSRARWKIRLSKLGDRNPMQKYPHLAEESGIRLTEYYKQHPEKHPNAILGKAGHRTYIERVMEALLTEEGISFSSQHPVAGLWIDIALVEHKIAVECDGERWHQDKEAEKKRDARLEAEGWTVLHFTGKEIKRNCRACLAKIVRLLNNHEGNYRFSDLEVTSVTARISGRLVLYNLSVEEDESYVAKGCVVHNCRCCFYPADVGEYEEEQIRDKPAIQDALEEADIDLDVGEDRPKSILNADLIEFSLLYNAFCPTGSGGGVDPSCKPSAGGSDLQGDTRIDRAKKLGAGPEKLKELQRMASRQTRISSKIKKGTASEEEKRELDQIRDKWQQNWKEMEQGGGKPPGEPPVKEIVKVAPPKAPEPPKHGPYAITEHKDANEAFKDSAVEKFVERQEEEESQDPRKTEILSAVSDEHKKLLVKHNGELVGALSYQSIGLSARANYSAVAIHQLGSLKPGVGSALVQELQSKHDFIRAVSVRDEARPFYKKMGFVDSANNNMVWDKQQPKVVSMEEIRRKAEEEQERAKEAAEKPESQKPRVRLPGQPLFRHEVQSRETLTPEEAHSTLKDKLVDRADLEKKPYSGYFLSTAKAFDAAVEKSLEQYHPRALKFIAQNVDQIHVVPLGRLQKAWENRGGDPGFKAAAFYGHRDKVVALSDAYRPDTIAHEFAHAVDRNGAYTNRAEWVEAYHKDTTGRMASGESTLREYAFYNQREGWAVAVEHAQDEGVAKLKKVAPNMAKLLIDWKVLKDE